MKRRYLGILGTLPKDHLQTSHVTSASASASASAVALRRGHIPGPWPMRYLLIHLPVCVSVPSPSHLYCTPASHTRRANTFYSQVIRRRKYQVCMDRKPVCRREQAPFSATREACTQIQIHRTCTGSNPSAGDEAHVPRPTKLLITGLTWSLHSLSRFPSPMRAAFPNAPLPCEGRLPTWWPRSPEGEKRRQGASVQPAPAREPPLCFRPPI